MAEKRGRPAPVDELVAFLFDGVRDEALAGEVAAWMGLVPRFRAFVDANRDKVRKKLRTAAGVAGRRDVRLELVTARLLLAERRLELAFEPYGSRGGPDFRVAMGGQAPFNLEVTRLRTAADDAHVAAQLLTKLHQLPPSVPNAVLVALELDSVEAVDLPGIVRQIRARADAQDEAFFVSRGFGTPRGFYQRFLRLGGAFLFSEAASGHARAAMWMNPSARIRLPERAARASLDLLRGQAAEPMAGRRGAPVHRPPG